MSVHDIPAIHHIACQAVLAMAARSVADREFETDSEVSKVQIVVSRVDGGVSAVEVEFVSSGGFPMGGVSL